MGNFNHCLQNGGGYLFENNGLRKFTDACYNQNN